MRSPPPLVICHLSFFLPSVRSQELWEYSPYRVRVWIALEPNPQFTDRLFQQIQRTFGPGV
jgi:hypothetical protein